ncbi:MAG: protein-glutamate O-methyltransferase CheR [Spirochaetaceae bacterium]|jgi:chemotaxis protein methyltransferase CheR|nr:protein-glutamate O-methyltransferase CheR [Spirochaetaceae bacterium]
MSENFVFTDADFENYRKLIYKECGITFTETNRPILESRIREQLRARPNDTVSSFFSKLGSDSGELRSFLDAVTTNLTRFFRNQAHFDAMQHYVIPELIKAKQASGNFHLKIWSAGCSTGEEPYTIAMLLSDILPPPWTFDIMASDISLKSLMTAKEGFYADGKIDGVPAPYLTRFFNKVPGGYKIHPDIASKIRFDYHNLQNDSGFRNLDIVFCRNVIIYFDDAAQKTVINHFYDDMASKSFLFIGHSESLFGMDTKFEFVKNDWAKFYRKWI